MWASILALCLVNVYSSFALSGEEIAKDLRSSLSPESGIYLPGDPQWQTNVLQPWNQWSAPNFKLSVKPKQQEDVQKVIRYAKQHDVSFFTMGGGHGYSGTRSKCDGAIQIDMGNFKTVVVDPAKNTLTIGGSVRFSDLAGPVYTAKKSIAIGTCSCVGMTGATLGGGIGFYSGLYGAISDSLVSLNMVSESGDIVTASESENSDLLWGMRGAGFNFGTVTSLTYTIYDYPNEGQAMNTDMLFPISQNGSIWEVMGTFFANQPKELSIVVGLMFDSNAQQVVIAVNTIYLRPVDEGKKLLKPFFDLNPMNTNISYLPWKDVPDVALYGSVASVCLLKPFYVPYTANLHIVDVNKMIRIANSVNDTFPSNPQLQGSLVTFFQYAPWGFQQRASNYSAFPHREPTIFAQFDGMATSADDVPAVDSFGKHVRDLLDEGSSAKDKTVYTHYAHGDEGPEAWYTEDKLPHLRELKARFDSKGAFSCYNPIS